MLNAAPSAVVRLPDFVGSALRPLPLPPLEFALRRLTAGIIARHPHVLERLGSYQAKRIAIEPTDLPFAILLEPRRETIDVRLMHASSPAAADARIHGPLLALIGLVDSAHDGDALFFSREIAIEGDVECVLALRNAIDDAQIDLARETTAWAGPLATPLHYAARAIATGFASAIAAWRRPARPAGR